MLQPLSAQRELRGYLDAPKGGVRWNEKIHPWTKSPAVDVIHLQADTDEGYGATLAHFGSLGYVWWSGGADCRVATLLLPKLDISGRPEIHAVSTLVEIRRSVASLVARKDSIGLRALRAVLSLEGAPEATAVEISSHEDPLGAAIAFHQTRARPKAGSVLASYVPPIPSAP